MLYAQRMVKKILLGFAFCWERWGQSREDCGRWWEIVLCQAFIPWLFHGRRLNRYRVQAVLELSVASHGDVCVILCDIVWLCVCEITCNYACTWYQAFSTELNIAQHSSGFDCALSCIIQHSKHWPTLLNVFQYLPIRSARVGAWQCLGGIGLVWCVWNLVDPGGRKWSANSASSSNTTFNIQIQMMAH